MDMIIKKEETNEWLKDYPHCQEFLIKGYREAILDMTNNILSDPRSSKNSYILNNEFENQPIYFMGFESLSEQSLFILSCIYVFPAYRKKGFGTHLINTSKTWVKNQAAIQVAVEEEKIFYLDSFYKNHGFITTGIVKKNMLNRGYVDYFWSANNIQLKDVPAGTVVESIS